VLIYFKIGKLQYFGTTIFEIVIFIFLLFVITEVFKIFERSNRLFFLILKY
jgi:hypothetical protein